MYTHDFPAFASSVQLGVPSTHTPEMPVSATKPTPKASGGYLMSGLGAVIGLRALHSGSPFAANWPQTPEMEGWDDGTSLGASLGVSLGWLDSDG